MSHDHPRTEPASRCFWGSRYSIGLVLLGAIAAYLLLSEHRAHILGAWPLLLLMLACPLIHMFMHRGHAGQGRHLDETRVEDPQANSAPTPTQSRPEGRS